ncbi:tetratricopeptide repeat protein [Streptomyces sp. 8K308]|uniref:tetratricopeptide repeat protein n=1 Tax=Streptomyces sp. 8K308 TaxID=2530388 RepID=UPI001052F407|nr:tetratricopeptide repeat protein [Streptomyces sp. 8K308]TDC23384.1 tetratricopeptide repeat protein [Streptomyces sp. 8K308]
MTVGDEVHDVIEAMAAVAGRLRRDGKPLERFEKRLKEYRQRRHEVERGQAAAEPAADVPSVGGLVTAQAGLAAAGAVPQLGAVTGAMDPTTVALSIDRARSWTSARLRAPEDVQLVLSPVKQLTPVFLTDLAEAARERALLVLFFDGYERLGPLLDGWLRQVIQEDTHGVLEANVVVVLSGQGRLDPRHWADWASDAAEVPLDVFSEQEARDLLTARGVTDPDTVEVILRLSGRLPVLLDMLAHPRPATPGEVVDPAETAVERFLKWEHDPDRRAATLACALPLHLDEDVYRTLAPEGAADQYPRLRNLPFVGHHDGRHRYHDTVRALMLRHQRGQYPTRWAAQQATLSDVYRARREALEADLTPHRDQGYWHRARWREARQGETYHRLCANPAAALPTAVADTVGVCQRTSALRQWVQTLERAWRDTDASELAHWARRLTEAVESEQPTERVLALLVVAPELDAAARAAAYTLSGRLHYDKGEYEEAVLEYDEALRLAPDSAWALAYRGDACRLLRRYDDALRDLDRAIQLDGSYAWALGVRGSLFSGLRRYEEALRDLDRAIDLETDSAWEHAQRGMVHRLSGWYEAAVADFDKAIRLGKDDAWTRWNRGAAHNSAGLIEEAVRDFDRALDMEPDDAWAHASRGSAYRLAGSMDLAVVDLDRALERDPDNPWAYAERGEAHRLAGRPEEAVADLDRALELDPDYAWAFGTRGQIHRSAGIFEAPLRDYGRAIELDPDKAWLHHGRGETHQFAGDHEAAIADFAEAIRLDPGMATAYAERGHSRLATRAYADAISDYDRALRLGGLTQDSHEWGTTHTWALIRRGEARLLSRAAGAALDDLAEALGRAPDHAWACLARALAARRLGDAEEDAYCDGPLTSSPRTPRAMTWPWETSFSCTACDRTGRRPSVRSTAFSPRLPRRGCFPRC